MWIVVDDTSVPVPRTHLDVEDLKLLEDLRLTSSAEYTPVHSSSGRVPQHVLPSLTRLDLQVQPHQSIEALRWLVLVSNIQELNVMSSAQYPTNDTGISHQDGEEIPFIHLAHLRTMRIANTVKNLDGRDRMNTSSAWILRHTACPSLTELHLRLTSVGSDNTFYEFFRRSSHPPLDTLHLYIDRVPGYREYEVERGGLRASARVNTREFVVHWETSTRNGRD